MNISFNIIFFSFVAVFGTFMVVNAVWQQRIIKLAISTHRIVNSQRSAMITAIYLLSQRIAKENPDDELAQEAVARAQLELEMLDKPRRVAL